MQDILVYLIRCVIVIGATWLVTNFIGKKSFAQLTPYDLAILFIISNVGAQPLVNKDSFKTALGMIIMGVSIVVIARLSLRPFFYRVDYTPSIVIAGGKINKEELRRNNLSIYMLLSMLRVQGYWQVADVNFAILESGGNLSVLPKAKARPVTPDDLQLTPEEDGLTYAVILDGTLMKKSLRPAGINEEWLRKELRAKHHADVKQILYAEVDGQHQLSVQKYPS
ncbi:DUF421 domain-containing protein [Paenibacillus sp. GCM10023252]|uniref:DUF421 domain-containing protein n=1 Tax=Paenibacillus sp. GCM10023252 TaxID=3252649 RepID=UPI0036100C31